MNIGYDLDGTLFSIKEAINCFNEELGKAYKVKDFHSYFFSEIFNIPKEQEIAIFNKYMERIITESRPLDTVVNHLKQMHLLGHNIVIITARPKCFEQLNKEVLQSFNIPFNKIYLGENSKYHAVKNEKLHRFFDDKGELIDNLYHSDLSTKCEFTLIDAPYNQGFACHSRLYL